MFFQRLGERDRLFALLRRYRGPAACPTVLRERRKMLGGGLRSVVIGLALLAVPTETRAQSLADELSRPGEADAEAERATEEILQPLEESPEMRPDEQAATAFAPPPGARRLSKASNLWVDIKQRRVYLDGYVTLREGHLEMFACPVGTKEHESIVATLARSREVHAALLAVGAMPGSPVSYDPDFMPPTGQAIRVWVLWRDKDGDYQTADARRWVQSSKTGESMKEDWVFGGSDFWKDPDDGQEYYQADGGDMICVANFSTAMMDVPFPSSADADSLLFVPFKKRVPELATPVRLVLVPIPGTADAPSAQPAIDPDQPPEKDVLPAAPAQEDPAAGEDPPQAQDSDRSNG